MTDLPTELPNFSTTGRYINQQGAQTESLAIKVMLRLILAVIQYQYTSYGKIK